MQHEGVRLVIFDLDGTLTEPHLDFAKIRRVIGAPDNMLVLDYMLTLEGEDQRRAFSIMQEFEDEAAHNSTLRLKAKELLQELQRRKIITAVHTRNSRRSVDIVFNKHGIEVDNVFTRENAPPKPDPHAVLVLLEKYEVDRDQAVFVGDFRPDIETGRNAGIRTVLLRSDVEFIDDGIKPDAIISSLEELVPLFEQWFPKSRV